MNPAEDLRKCRERFTSDLVTDLRQEDFLECTRTYTTINSSLPHEYPYIVKPNANVNKSPSLKLPQSAVLLLTPLNIYILILIFILTIIIMNNEYELKM